MSEFIPILSKIPELRNGFTFDILVLWHSFGCVDTKNHLQTLHTPSFPSRFFDQRLQLWRISATNVEFWVECTAQWVNNTFGTVQIVKLPLPDQV